MSSNLTDPSARDLAPGDQQAITIPWEQALADAQAMPVHDVAALLEQPLLFENDCLPGEAVAVVPEHGVPDDLWFIGDLHCDLLALVNAWHYIDRQSRAESRVPSLLFLGDFVDRGLHAHETLLYLFRLIRDNPGRISVLPGNHDEDYHWDASAGRFISGVDPAESTDALNALLEKTDTESQERIALGKLACTFFSQRPRAVILPDGLLAAHGGFPHTDRLERLKQRADLSHVELCLQDFVWLRLGDGPRKRPYRGEKGCEFGYDDFTRFCRRCTDQLGIPVQRFLRGHDHIDGPERYDAHDHWPNPILTINTMCRRLAGESKGGLCPRACVARHRPGLMPEVHVVTIDEAVIRAVYFADVPARQPPSE